MEQVEEMLEVLNKFNTGKVRVVYDFCCSTVAYTYMNFCWDIDVESLVLGDMDTIHEDFSSIDIDEILDVTEINDDLIEIELENGKIQIFLDTNYSLCFYCKDKHPVFYIRAIGETNEEYDIKICQDCFNKIVEMKI
jgi:hypothetical protein